MLNKRPFAKPVFTGFEPADGRFPDATTICRFRSLGQQG